MLPLYICPHLQHAVRWMERVPFWGVCLNLRMARSPKKWASVRSEPGVSVLLSGQCPSSIWDRLTHQKYEPNDQSWPPTKGDNMNQKGSFCTTATTPQKRRPNGSQKIRISRRVWADHFVDVINTYQHHRLL